MDSTPKKILFLCTGNSCRSILAEAILQQRGSPRFQAFSAGSHPKRTVHPQAIALLKKLRYQTASFRSKSWDEFIGNSAPKFDIVITVCGNADQACPVFPGQVNRHHWGFDDPAKASGSDAEKLVVFRRVRDEIRRVFDAYAAGRVDQLKIKS